MREPWITAQSACICRPGSVSNRTTGSAGGAVRRDATKRFTAV